jgi:type II secretory pathway predicted ATPase ExeA
MHSTPFTREIRVEHLFSLPFFEEALMGLQRAVEQRMSAVVIAPAGVGKSSLLRALHARLPEARYRCRYIKMTDLSKRDLCREIAVALTLPPAGSYNMLVRRIQEDLVRKSETDGTRPVLLVDEAHGLRQDVLDLLAVITNFEMDSQLVLSVVLAGQPPLGDLLRNPKNEGVARRIAHYAALRPLSRDETNAYIHHRSVVAGAVTTPFDADAVDAIYEIGRGNPRATDNLALKSLEMADAKGITVVDAVLVVEARRVLWPA